MGFNNLYSLLEEGSREYGVSEALVSMVGGKVVRSISFIELRERVSVIARGLISLGLKKSNTVCILSGSASLDVTLIELAIIACGGISVSIHDGLSLEEIVSIVNDSEARFLFTEGEASYFGIEGGISVGNIIYISSSLPEGFRLGGVRFFCLDNLIEFGGGVSESVFRGRVSGIGLDDLALLVYTSGTTARSKGVVFTHRNVLRSIESLSGVLPFSFCGFKTCHIMPLSYIDGKFLQFFCIYRGVVQYYSNDIYRDLREIGPDFLFAGSSFLTWLYEIFSVWSFKSLSSFLSSSSLFSSLFSSSSFFARLFSYLDRGVSSFCGVFIRVFIDFVNRVYKDISVCGSGGGGLSLKGKLLRFFLLYRFRRFVGDNISFILISGGIVLEDFRVLFSFLGISLFEGYSLTELSSIVHINMFVPGSSFSYDSFSYLLEGVSLKLSLENEVLVRTDNIMFSYYKDESGLDGFLDKDGYFCTGDLASIGVNGVLSVIGRKLDVIVSESGDLVSSLYLEWKFRLGSIYIRDIFVYGGARGFVTALIVLDRGNMTRVVPLGRLGDNFARYIQGSFVISFIEGELARINEGLRFYERVEKFAIVEDDFADSIDGVLTPTLKLKRHIVVSRYRKLFDQFYGERYN